MKNKLIIGAVAIAVLAFAGGTVTASMQSTNHIFDISRGKMKVSTFWHDGNRCYVATGNTPELSIDQVYTSTISCVRYQ